MKKAVLFLLLGTVAVGSAQTPLSPVWTRPALYNPFLTRVQPGAGDGVLVVDFSQIVMLDRATGRMRWHRRCWPDQAQFTSNGASVVLSEGSSFEPNRIVVLDAATGALQRTVLEGTNARAFVLSPDDSKITVSYYGSFRLADGAQLTTSSPNFSDGAYSPNGQWATLSGQIYRASDMAQPYYLAGSAGAAFHPDSTRLLVLRYGGVAVLEMASSSFVREFPLPADFRARTIVALGTTGRFVATGCIVEGGIEYAAWCIFDANGNITETKRLDHRVSDNSGYYSAAARGNGSVLFTTYGEYGVTTDRLVELPISATGRSGTALVKIDAAQASNYLSGGVGPQLATATDFHTQLDLLSAVDGSLLRRLPHAVASRGSYFGISGSGRYLWYTLRGGGFPLNAVTVPGGGVANSASFDAIVPTLPLPDDTFLMRYERDVFRLKRANGIYEVVRNFGADEKPVAAAIDSRTWIGVRQAGISLRDTSKATLLARTNWPWTQNSEPDTDWIQIAAPSPDEIVIARRGIEEGGARAFVEMRRYARAGAALVARGPAVKRTYPTSKTINGSDTYMEVVHRLSPDGRTVWVNHQEDEAGSYLSNVGWTGELLRTSDAAVLLSHTDPTFDMGVTSTAISPSNGLVFLGRLNGTIQAVPMPGGGLAGAVAAPFELAGGEPRVIRLDLAAPAPVARNVALQGDAVAGVPNTVQIPAGARFLEVPVLTLPVAATQAGTVRVTDLGKTAQVFLRVVPPRIAVATFPAATVASNTTAVLTISLDGAAPAGGAAVVLSDNSTAALTPASATVPAGARTVQVQIPVRKVTNGFALRVTLRREGRTLVVPVTVTP